MAYKQLSIRERNEAKLGWKLVAPTVIIIAALIVYPIFYNIYLSFFKVSLSNKGNVFVGFQNYTNILSDSSFWMSFFITVMFTLLTVGGSILLGLGVALLMNREFPGRTFVRALILLPYVTPLIAIVFAWKYIFLPVDGPLMKLLGELHLMNPGMDFINNPNNSFWVVVIFNIWRNFPFVYLMILARLQSIPSTYYEAAEMDGAKDFEKFWYVTLPELYFVLGSIALLRGIWNFYKFDEVYLMSKVANTLPIYIYNKAFSGIPQQGVAASIATMLFVVMSLMIGFYVKKVLKW